MTLNSLILKKKNSYIINITKKNVTKLIIKIKKLIDIY